MNTIYTTVAENYVADWGIFEGIREIMQNALDAHDLGYTAGLKYVKKHNKLVIFNRGVSLERSSLLLGHTTKAGVANQRGNYGEGFKVGSLALYREDKHVTIYTGDETWYPTVRDHPDVDTPVLAFDIEEDNPYKGRLTFEISNITPEEWKDLKANFLPLCGLKKESYYNAPGGRILLEDKYKGNIYSGGIYVAGDRDLQYGYDFKPQVLKLNRDRNLVDSFNLKWNTSKMWAYISANKEGQLFNVRDMLKTDCLDVQFLDEFSDYTVKGKLAEDFFEENSEKSYPVTSNEESTKVKSMGYDPVYSSPTYTSSIRQKLGTIEDLERKVQMDWKLFNKITATDDANISWVFEVLHTYDDKFHFDMKIAKFVIDTTRSVIQDENTIVINCNLLKDKYEMLHEVINLYTTWKDISPTRVWVILFKQLAEGITEV